MLSRKVEDYLEAILNITNEQGYARVKNVSIFLNVKPPSVVEMLKKLNHMGFVEHKKYEDIILTPKGYEIAIGVKDKHDTIKAFLEIIKVPVRIADKDACIIEHELDPITITQVKSLVEFVKTSPHHPEWLKHFEIFCDTRKHVCEKRDYKNHTSHGQ